MSALLAAKAVFLLHLGFLAFVVFGGLLVLMSPRIAWLHLPALAWGVWIVLSHGLCRLTVWEAHLLAQAGQASYDGGFIDHYLVPILYPPGLSARRQTVLGMALAAWNVALYGAALWRVRQRSRSPS